MTSRIIVTEPFDYVVFGGTGDLARRKLMPALYHRDLAGQLPPSARIIGVSHRPGSTDAYREEIGKALTEASARTDDARAAIDRFLQRLFLVTADGRSDDGWAELRVLLQARPDSIRAFYLATAPDLFDQICRRIGAHGLVSERARLVVEKPFGTDFASAHALNEAIGHIFHETQIYRIDHYLGKETVQNLLALRFANALFEPLWNAGHIDHVQITVAEALGVGQRVGYYDTAGAMRDMVQNHLMQLLCLVGMEPRSARDADALRDEKLKVLRSLKPIDGSLVPALTVRGQYRAGMADGAAVPSYLEELGERAQPSQTETFIALKAEIANWRWAGVPFYLRTGKRLPERVSEIVITFRAIPHSVFDGAAGPISPNRLVIRLQPDEGIKLELMIKDPGPGGMRLRQVPLDMSFSDTFGVHVPEAYERLLLDVIRGDQTLFMRRDEVEAAWGWVDPIIAAWQASGEPPRPYPAGTWGPSAAIALIERDGRTWHEDGA
ncbi:glucose-6-phosphate dehydrogenase [Roseomonas hellenica]|uniref:Glucose-6-phosphate 1-dehydrogenase n=1 Tax=Plastoroseomonas hellenica TaxID=2687306 RepID=A0ABS5F2D3_9PROT|nr:glucose-6-phosphate dehydrogenase [Plastoroseomonas hellenica]MBR0666623.1 glucose-6-phosphate dehydrogenase [Plastoroseomonas hellenica]